MNIYIFGNDRHVVFYLRMNLPNAHKGANQKGKIETKEAPLTEENFYFPLNKVT